MFLLNFNKDDVLRGALYILNAYFCNVCKRIDLDPDEFPEPAETEERAAWIYWSSGVGSRGGQTMVCFSDKTDSVLNYFIFRIKVKFLNDNKRKREGE